MSSEAPLPSLPACQSPLAEKLQEIAARLGSTEIQSLLASIKECGPTMLYNLFVKTLESPPERNLTIPSCANLDAAWNEFDAQFQDLKLLLLGQKPSEVTPPPSPPDPPKEETPTILIDGLAVAKPTFDLDSEIPLNTRMLLIVLRGGYLSDSGLFVCRVQQSMRDILVKFRVQCQTNDQLRFVNSPSAFADLVCIVETPGMNVAPKPTSEAKSERVRNWLLQQEEEKNRPQEPKSEQIPATFVEVQKLLPPKQENRPQERKMSLTAQGGLWKFCIYCKAWVKECDTCKTCKRTLQSSISEADYLAAEAGHGGVQPEPKPKPVLKRSVTSVLEGWVRKRPLKRPRTQQLEEEDVEFEV